MNPFVPPRPVPDVVPLEADLPTAPDPNYCQDLYRLRLVEDDYPWRCTVAITDVRPDEAAICYGPVTPAAGAIRCDEPARYQTALRCPLQPADGPLLPTCDQHTADVRMAAETGSVLCLLHDDAPHCVVAYVTSADPATVRAWPPPRPNAARSE